MYLGELKHILDRSTRKTLITNQKYQKNTKQQLEVPERNSKQQFEARSTEQNLEVLGKLINI